jgi:pilus assembly protein CpaE
VIPFDPQMFGTAANNGQMIAEISANHRTTEMFLQIAQRLTGRGETKKPRALVPVAPARQDAGK